MSSACWVLAMMLGVPPQRLFGQGAIGNWSSFRITTRTRSPSDAPPPLQVAGRSRVGRLHIQAQVAETKVGVTSFDRLGLSKRRLRRVPAKYICPIPG